MKLDASVMRTMSKEDYRVLLAVEIGMKSHEIVPAKICISLAKLRHGGANKVMASLLRDKLLSHDGSKGYDGYRLTNSGYDILALKSLTQKGIVSALGDKIGIGKESDIYIAADPNGRQVVLKFHRLGRTSFRAVRRHRDYLNNSKSGQAVNWLFMSRLSALKEFAFMKALHQVGYPTPTPLEQNRHVVAMTLVRGSPLYQIRTRQELSAEQAQSIFEQSVALATRLARHGLVHCDLNEFNLMVDLSGVQAEISGDGIGDHYVRHSGSVLRGPGALSAHQPIEAGENIVDGTGEKIVEALPTPKKLLDNGEPKPLVTLIDFPQMVSVKHPNAKTLYERDVNCLIRFFKNKLRCYVEDENGGTEGIDLADGWRFEDVTKNVGNEDDTENEREKEEGVGQDEQIAAEPSTIQVKKRTIGNTTGRLDKILEASGFCGKNNGNDAMELYYFERNRAEEGEEDEDEGEGEGEDEDEEEDLEEGGQDGHQHEEREERVLTGDHIDEDNEDDAPMLTTGEEEASEQETIFQFLPKEEGSSDGDQQQQIEQQQIQQELLKQRISKQQAQMKSRIQRQASGAKSARKNKNKGKSSKKIGKDTGW